METGTVKKLVGRVAKEHPGKILVATKIPPKNMRWPAQPGIGIERVFPFKYIVKCTEQSLRNLGLEAVDLQQLHVWNPEWLRSDDWRRGVEDLKRSGKVRAFGISINDHQPDSRARDHRDRPYRHSPGNIQHLRPKLRRNACFHFAGNARSAC